MMQLIVRHFVRAAVVTAVLVETACSGNTSNTIASCDAGSADRAAGGAPNGSDAAAGATGTAGTAGAFAAAPAWCPPLPGKDPAIVDFEGVTVDDLSALTIGDGGHAYVYGYDYTDSSATLVIDTPGSQSSHAGHVHADASQYGMTIYVSPFHPDCWGASAYRGLSFDVKGTGGAVTVTAWTLQVLPATEGGQCPGTWAECTPYTLRKPITATDWSSFSITWDQFKSPATSELLNPGVITSISFDITGTGQPADLWLDNLAFLSR